MAAINNHMEALLSKEAISKVLHTQNSLHMVVVLRQVLRIQDPTIKDLHNLALAGIGLKARHLLAFRGVRRRRHLVGQEAMEDRPLERAIRGRGTRGRDIHLSSHLMAVGDIRRSSRHTEVVTLISSFLFPSFFFWCMRYYEVVRNTI
jgi:hypothetical protein